MEIYKNLSLEDMEGEIWKDIEGYEGLYQVSNVGRVKSLNYNKTKKPGILKQAIGSRGYCFVSLHKNNQKKSRNVHVLVAKTFIPNVEGKESVDHINTIKEDNRVCNLRWATATEQMSGNEITHERMKEIGKVHGKINIKKAVESTKRRVKCTTTNKIFNSIVEASQYYGITRSHVSSCCRGKRKTCGGKQWEYID